MAAPPPPNPLVPTNPGAFSQAGVDLGMGADLQQQVMDQILERRKRTLLAANQTSPAYGALAMGDGVTGAGNTGGIALQALMGSGITGG
jgi:hypothetical protein